MSGIAFYIDASFDAHLEISPTPSGEIPVMGIKIVGEDSPSGMTAKYSVVYVPGSTTQKGVTWSVVNGASFAAIGSQNGELSINETAHGSPVKIRATSTADPSVYAEKELTVFYYVGEVSDEINAYCDRVAADGGVLLKGSKGSTMAEFAKHQSLLGVKPKIDFLGYKLDGSGEAIIKLYSLDQRFDSTELTGISLQDGIITASSDTGFIRWAQNFALTGLAEMEHLYYEGPLTQINSADSIFIANLLKTSYEQTTLKRSAIFFQGNKLNFQYAASDVTTVNGFPCPSPTKFKVVVDGSANGKGFKYVSSLVIDDGPEVSSQNENGADFWGRAIDAVSFIKLYSGYKLCIAG